MPEERPWPKRGESALVLAYLEQHHPDKRLYRGAHHDLAKVLGVSYHAAVNVSRYGWYVNGPITAGTRRFTAMQKNANEPRTIKELEALAKSQGWDVIATNNGHFRYIPPDKSKPTVIVTNHVFDQGNRPWLNARADLRRSGMLFGDGTVAGSLPAFPEVEGNESVAEATLEDQEPEAEESAVSLPSPVEERCRRLEEAVALLTAQQDELTARFINFRKAANEGIDGLLELVNASSADLAAANIRIADCEAQWRETIQLISQFDAHIRQVAASVAKADPLAAYRKLLDE